MESRRARRVRPQDDGRRPARRCSTSRPAARSPVDASDTAVVAPKNPFGIPASFYRRFITDRPRRRRRPVHRPDPRHGRRPALRRRRGVDGRQAWQAAKGASPTAELPSALRRDLETQLVRAVSRCEPGSTVGAAAVVGAGRRGQRQRATKLPNMAGAFDSHTARWTAGANAETTVAPGRRRVRRRTDRGVRIGVQRPRDRRTPWHNVDLDEGSVTMAVLVMPNEDDELANGVLRVNRDLAGFFSVTGETQYGENLVTNPEAGASPGHLDRRGLRRARRGGAASTSSTSGSATSPRPTRPGCTRSSTPRSMPPTTRCEVIRAHFARLEGRPESTTTSTSAR